MCLLNKLFFGTTTMAVTVVLSIKYYFYHPHIIRTVSCLPGLTTQSTSIVLPPLVLLRIGSSTVTTESRPPWDRVSLTVSGIRSYVEWQAGTKQFLYPPSPLRSAAVAAIAVDGVAFIECHWFVRPMRPCRGHKVYAQNVDVYSVYT